MKIIGVTGGVGCGKSAVLEEISRRYNIAVLSADDIAKELMQKGMEIYDCVVESLGTAFLDDEGDLNRAKMADVVFKEEDKRRMLNSIVHPAVKRYIENSAELFRKEGGYDFVFVEAALLIEDHYETICDEFWYIYADIDVRRKRLKESRGYSDQRINDMLASQLSEEEFRRNCAFTVDNSGTMDNTMAQIEKILEE